ncbi:MAG: outer membrane lipoprotein carrier protein LolA [Alphaproteobacteria bacterium]|nr:outer membrane lipoprotein carrier protein LolA [Alphaproteobacteria bacterium]
MRYFLLALALLGTTPVAFAQIDPSPERLVAQAEAYLRNLDTIQSRFVQIGNDGSRLEGVFYLDRPGRLRFEYDSLDDFIVADGTFIYFYDSELGEQSNAPIGQTLADFILRDDPRLSGDVTVQNVWREAGAVYVTLVQTSDPGAGSLRLVFQEQPFVLRMWRVVDSQGYITDMYLTDLHQGVELPRSLFVYRDPERDVQRLNP